MKTSSTDRIEREIHLKAPITRVWHALSDASTFGEWFGVALVDQHFVPGGRVRGHITHLGYEHLVFEALIERVEPQHLLSFRWHPYAAEPSVDYSHEPTTLVEFSLEETGDGVLLRVVESGFDQIPVKRRAEAYRMNSGGWDQQMQNIARHVAAD